MCNQKKIIVSFIILLAFYCKSVNAEIVYNSNSIDIQAVKTTASNSKFPDFSKIYLGEDKHEKFNRKMFNLNSKLNKYVARPVHVVWSSLMPKFGMDRIRDAYNNIEYPKRLVSCIIQRDGKAVKIETIRFLTNTTLGIGGLFDPADKILNIKPTNENMEQALCKCKMKSGSYLVMPGINSCTPRSLCGRALEAALDPAVYLCSPIVSIVKAGLMINRTSYMQPLAEIIEKSYADPYDIHKKLFGIENFIKNANLDRDDKLIEKTEFVKNDNFSSNDDSMVPEDTEQKVQNRLVLPIVPSSPTNLDDILPLNSAILKSDIALENFNPQSPVVDSMRTALFENPDIDKSIWNELSVWNRSFAKRIKTDKIIVTENKPEYYFKYILQKDKTSPLIIIYPSIGEGAGSHHSIVFAKLFYDKGYSVVLQGNHFQWEFVQSMPDGYYPGLPKQDVQKIQIVTSKIINKLEDKYDCKFSSKTVFGTSFGAMAALFLAEQESHDNTLAIDKYIAVSPPIELEYALKQADSLSELVYGNEDEIKQKTARTAAKILQLLELKNNKNFKIDTLPFSEEEGKIITAFILRQKLSDVIFAIENSNVKGKNKLYDNINNMSFSDYAEKYLGLNMQNSSDRLYNEASLFALSDYLQNNNNYKIYHSADDYFVNKSQIIKLKNITNTNHVCLNYGAHLGFLYRKEFENALLNDIKLLPVKKEGSELHQAAKVDPNEIILSQTQ